MEELLSDFVAETMESLQALTNMVVALEADPSNRALIDRLFRFFHTVKGSCGFLDLPRFERLSHAAEDVLSDIRSGRAAPDAATISAVLSVMDRIGELCAAVAAGDSLSDRNDEHLIATLRLCHDRAREGRDDMREARGVFDTKDYVRPLPERRAAAPAARTVRLPLPLIDQVMDGMADLMRARDELAQTLHAAGQEPNVDAAFESLSARIAEMGDTISRMRLQRVDRLFMALPRVVRDLSREQGKAIMLEMEGGEVEMDREMIQMILDPLMQIVRNSIGHGIETPEERRAAGKPEAGVLRVSARRSGDQIVIEMKDDGRGVDIDAVLARVVASGRMSEDEIASLDDQGKLDLIFTPGLSTACRVTAVSGRGVGMDIVRANIERIGGVVALSSERGKGLAIAIRVPLGRAIMPGAALAADLYPTGWTPRSSSGTLTPIGHRHDPMGEALSRSSSAA